MSRLFGRFLGRLRAYLLAGLLVTAPLAITFYVVRAFVSFIDGAVTPLLPVPYRPETYLPFAIPGTGIIVVLVGLVVIGWLAAGIVGRFLVHLGERIVNRMPVIRSVYGSVKQILETVIQTQNQAFREVVLFEYPRRGCWAMGFITNQTSGEIQNITADDMVNVFLPTTPNPTSGYLLFLPRKDVVTLDMTVEEGVKLIVSGGIITPPDRRPAAVQSVPKVSSGTRVVRPPRAD
ncbi:MAG: DUF502 domain-containing protein [Acetobacterales bacterium]